MPHLATLQCLDRADRFEAASDATLRDTARRPIDAVVTDLSLTGFRLTTGARLHPGDWVSVGMAGIRVRAAQVIRADLSGYGCMFRIPLTDAEIARALTTQPAAPVPLRPAAGAAAEPATTHPVDDGRLSPRVRLFAITGAIVLPWIAMIAVAIAL